MDKQQLGGYVIAATLDQITEYYVSLRDYRSQLKNQYDEADGKAKDTMSTLETEIMRRFNEMGVDSAKTAHGTAYISRTIQPKCTDWTSFWAHIQATGNFDLLQKRVGVTAIKTMIDETGAPPPGIEVTTVREINIRKS